MTFNHLKLGFKVLKSNFFDLKYPYKLNYVVTKECHSRCVNCHIWKETPQNELTLDEIKEFTIKNPFFSWINFTGGEPTDRKDFVEVAGAFIKNTKDLAMMHFPTNGLKPDHIADTAARIAALKPPSLFVTVSIDGPPAINDRIRGIQGDFESAIETLKKLEKIKGLKSYVGMTLYPSNYKTVIATFNEIKSRVPHFSWNRFHVNLAHMSAHYYSNSVVKRTTTPEMIAALREYRKKRSGQWLPVGYIENTFHRLAESYITNHVTPLSCVAVKASVFLSEHGKLFPCSIWDRPLGSLRETNYEIMPLINNTFGKETVRLIAEKKCAQCWTPCEAFQTIGGNFIRSLGAADKVPAIEIPDHKKEDAA